MNGSNRIERNRGYQKVRTKFRRANASSADMVKIGTRPGGMNASRENNCSFCKVSGNHGLWRCSNFLALKVSEPRVVAKRGKHCFCCLKVGHLAKECVGGFSCKECGIPHNRLLHVGREVQPRGVKTVKGMALVVFGMEVVTVKRDNEKNCIVSS